MSFSDIIHLSAIYWVWLLYLIDMFDEGICAQTSHVWKKELFCLQTFLSFKRATGRRPCLVWACFSFMHQILRTFFSLSEYLLLWRYEIFESMNHTFLSWVYLDYESKNVRVPSTISSIASISKLSPPSQPLTWWLRGVRTGPTSERLLKPGSRASASARMQNQLWIRLHPWSLKWKWRVRELLTCDSFLYYDCDIFLKESLYS